jgi:hypothetical protein
MAVRGKAPNFEGFGLLEREIRYAMSKSTSNSEAARYLGISYSTYKKYAKLYVDADTGLTLFELQTNKSKIARNEMRLNGLRVKKKYFTRGPELIEAILRGDIKPPSAWQFKYFLIREGIFEEKCMHCGFNERRVSDGKIPLHLIFLDGNTKNGKRENIELICYNHYYLYIGNIWGRPKRPKFDIPEDFE